MFREQEGRTMLTKIVTLQWTTPLSVIGCVFIQLFPVLFCFLFLRDCSLFCDRGRAYNFFCMLVVST